MTSDSEPILPVILCGGAGTRLWPLSHPARPKPLLALGEGGETLLGGTLARFADAGLYAPPTIVAGEEQGEAIAAEIRKSRIAEPMLILEPAARNTAPAIALAALAAEPGALLLVAPSDHVIARPQALHEAGRRARPFAAQGRLVAFGIAPDRPATGYGYVKAGAKLGDGVLEADAFVEKPDAGTAKKWLAQGGYYWNAGLFLMRADACLAALDL
ncbi:MAG: sugar phosphate nucleotidyltransferase, partial [Sphingomonadaceae bacterium]